MDDDIAFTRLDPDAGERFQRLRAELGVTSFGINLVTMQAGERSRIHLHERQEEVYLVLEGELTLAVEGKDHPLGEGEVARVAPAVRRQLVNRRPQRLVVLALGGATEHDPRDAKAFDSWESTEPRSPADVPFPDPLPITPT